MLPVILLKGWADLRSRRLQSLLLFCVIAVASGVGMLALGITNSAANAYDRVLSEAHGGHVWLFAPSPQLLQPATAEPGVAASSGPFEETTATLTTTQSSYPLTVWGMPGTMPTVAPALIREGRWIAPGATDELVVDHGLAAQAHLHVGDSVRVVGNGTERTLKVVGIGINTTESPYPLSTPADVFSSPATVQALANGSKLEYAVGVRLTDPAATGAFLTAARPADQVAGGNAIQEVTWQDIRNNLSNADRASVILLRTFAVFAFFAVGFVLANAVSGQVLSNYRDIGLLRAIGLTPGQVTVLLLAEQLMLAGVAAIAGAIVGVLLTPLMLNRVANLLGTTPTGSLSPGTVLPVVAAVLFEVVLFTLIPTWRGGRVSPVQALTVGPTRDQRRNSRLATAAERMHLPMSIVLGLKDAYSRPGRSWLSIAALIFAVSTLSSSLTVEATGNAIAAHPTRIGRPPYSLELSGSPNGTSSASVPAMSQSQMIALAEQQPSTESYVTIQDVQTSFDGHTYRASQAVGGQIGQMPYNIVAGRMFAKPGEAVVGVGLQRLDGLRVGQPLNLVLQGGGTMKLTLVGIVAWENNAGDVVFFPRTNLAAASPSLASRPAIVAIRLKPGSNSAAVAAALRTASGGRIGVDDAEAKFRSDLAAQRSDLRSVQTPLNISLIAIAIVNLVSTLAFAIRERVPEFGILKTIGCTPRQVYLSVLSTAALFAGIAIVVGIPIGYIVTAKLVDHFGAQGGWPTGVAVAPPALWLAVAVPAMAALVLLACTIPARLAARLSIAEALRFE